jgi:hypothetical protein
MKRHLDLGGEKAHGKRLALIGNYMRMSDRLERSFETISSIKKNRKKKQTSESDNKRHPFWGNRNRSVGDVNGQQGKQSDHFL